MELLTLELQREKIVLLKNLKEEKEKEKM